MQTKVGHFISIARVPDCVQLLPFEQLREAFDHYTDAATAIRLVRLHQGNALFPDVYFQFYGEHFTIMGLEDLTIQFGTADEFVGGYLVRRHMTPSGRKAHAMLPPGYVRGASCPIPSPTYPYQPCGTGIPGEQPSVHVVYMAALGTVLSSPQRFCLGEALAAEWPFDDVPVPWILLEGYRNPDGAAPDFPGDDNQADDSNGKGSGTAPDGPLAMGEDDKENDDDEGFETVNDGDDDTGDKVVVKVPVKDLAKPEGSGLMGANRLFDLDDEEEDAELKEQIEAAYKTADTIDELKLSETSSSSDSGSSNADGEDGDPNATKKYPKDPDAEEAEKPGPATVTGIPVVPAGSGNPGGPEPEPEVVPEQNSSETPGTKGKGPNSENSGKALATKSKLLASAEGVWERAQTMLFRGAALAQAMGSEGEEEVTRHLENYTGLLDGFQKLVGVMANGYEDATEDIRCLVASMLDTATERDRTFVAGASQALATWTTTYQEAMSQGESGSIPDQLARWDRVREAGIALSRQVTSLTTAHNPSSTSGEIFQRLLPACFDRVQLQTEATFSTLNASLPTLLCRFVRPDQAGQIFSSIFTCMCNYNTEVCGMAMAQTVVPVYTIPNTYRVQQSLWESLCQIIPGIARTDATSGAGGSGDPGATAMQEGSQPASASQTSHKKRTSRERRQGGVPLGIPLPGSTWVASSEFQNLPVINLTGDDNPSAPQPQDISAPIQVTLLMGRRVSGGKINVSKVDAHHLFWKLEDHQEMAWQRAEVEASDRTSSQGQGSGSGLPYGLPATLPSLAADEGILAKPSDLAPATPKQGKKRSHADWRRASNASEEKEKEEKQRQSKRGGSHPGSSR